jgi:endogenous inhibitor of DNA gyrase (YacG/DUF329 family)
VTNDNPDEGRVPWHHEVVATCPYCTQPVRRDDPRALDADERLGHLACVDVIEGECTSCGKPVSRRHKRDVLRDGIAHKACLEPKGRR